MPSLVASVRPGLLCLTAQLFTGIIISVIQYELRFVLAIKQLVCHENSMEKCQFLWMFLSIFCT